MPIKFPRYWFYNPENKDTWPDKMYHGLRQKTRAERDNPPNGDPVIIYHPCTKLLVLIDECLPAGSEDIYQEVGVHFAQENLKRRVRQFLRLLEQLADCVGSEIGGPLEGKLRNGTPVHILYRMCNDGCLPYDSNALTPQLLGTVEDVEFPYVAIENGQFTAYEEKGGLFVEPYNDHNPPDYVVNMIARKAEPDIESDSEPDNP